MIGHAYGYAYGRGCNKRFSRNSVRVLLVVVLVCSLFVGVLCSRNSNALAETASASLQTGNYASVKRNPIYASKRRIPSGPDPIHNRHVGQTRRPPGRA